MLFLYEIRIFIALKTNKKWDKKSNALYSSKVGFGYDNSVSFQTDDVGHVGATVLAHVACVAGLQTNDVLCN